MFVHTLDWALSLARRRQAETSRGDGPRITLVAKESARCAAGSRATCQPGDEHGQNCIPGDYSNNSAGPFTAFRKWHVGGFVRGFSVGVWGGSGGCWRKGGRGGGGGGEVT